MSSSWPGRVVGCALAAHVVLTAFENSPDAKVSFGSRGAMLARLPQWRFFAPNPGVDDTHLMFRARPRGTDWGPWEELPLVNRMSWLALVWNPGTRAPKALFDCAQQIRMMSSHGTKWEAATGSAAYRAMEHAIRVAAGRREADEAQFMIVASRPGDVESTMQPLVVSEPFAVGVVE